jgi:hypothetical protein
VRRGGASQGVCEVGWISPIVHACDDYTQWGNDGPRVCNVRADQEQMRKLAMTHSIPTSAVMVIGLMAIASMAGACSDGSSSPEPNQETAATSSGGSGGLTNASAGSTGDESGELITSPSDSRIPTFCADGASVACEMLGPCCVVDIAECEAQRALKCTEGTRNALEYGLAFSPVLASACVEASSRFYQGCESASPEDPVVQSAYDSCAGVTRGTLSPLSACEQDIQCGAAAGLVARCVFDGTGHGQCKTAAALAEGNDCGAAATGFCGAGLYCATNEPTPLCRPQGNTGEACNASDGCRAPRTCLNGQCTVELSLDGVCSSLAQSDE